MTGDTMTAEQFRKSMRDCYDIAHGFRYRAYRAEVAAWLDALWGRA